MMKTGRLTRTVTTVAALAWIACMGAAHAARMTRTFGQGRIGAANSIAVDPITKSVYVADRSKQQVLIFDRNGRYVRKFGGLGRGPGRFLSPGDVAVDAKGQVYVTDTGSYEKKIPRRDSEYVEGPHRIERFDRRGRYLGQRIFPPYTLVRGVSASVAGGVFAVMSYDGSAYFARFDSHLRSLPAPRVRWSSEDVKAIQNSQGYWFTALWNMKLNRLAAAQTPSGSVLNVEIVHMSVQGKIVKHTILHVEGSIVAIAADAKGHIYIAERVQEIYEVGPRPERRGRNGVLIYDQSLRQIGSFSTNAPTALAVDAGNTYIAGEDAVHVFHAANR
ncbi:MAG: 6-bladed beta-propeller [Capsulimonas sp.]|uniref:6-bladed beta-propeller n=1 Tax=Capsulimonas sp. TaxID=2494211 RepID=UPI00326509F2